MTTFRWGSATDTGRIRRANEDALLAVDGLFVVADGMGGHRAGEVASHLAVETLQDGFDQAGTDVLVRAVERANREVVERSIADPELAGMGTTIVAMALVDADGRDAIGVVNVGDSRLYLLSDGELHQITEDHSLVATMVRQGRITESEAAVHPQRNILTRALGIDGSVLVDSWEMLPVVGDRYLLCSDGLFNEVDDARIAATLRRLADPDEACRELVRLANESGGRDNITCVMVDVVDDTGRDTSVDIASRVRVAHTGGDAIVEGGTDPAKSADHPRRSASIGASLTWRVGAFVAAVFAIIGLAFGFVWWTGTRTYYVGVDDQENVTIYRGKPGGVLWIQPEVAEVTSVTLSEVPAASRDAVIAGVEEPSLDAAHRYIDNLIEQMASSSTTSTTTSSTTSTTSTVGTSTTAG